MKFLLIDTFIHKKNRIGFDLMCKSKNIDYVVSKNQKEYSNEWDLVFIPAEPINPAMFPNTKCIMYGPHNFVFVNGIWKKNTFEFPANCFYNLLSKWITEVQDEFGGLSLKVETFPFAVDVDTFKPLENKIEPEYDCFVYYKARDPKVLEFVTKTLQMKNLRFVVIRYGKYTEEEYKYILHSTKFGIWVGCHESQGFALEECLSTNVPLLVWNVTSMFDEYNNEGNIAYTQELGRYMLKATSIPYWDDRCGLVSTEKDSFLQNLDSMIKKYQEYRPRDYIVETLSPRVCMERLLDIIPKQV
jgi:hypothetical protein